MKRTQFLLAARIEERRLDLWLEQRWIAPLGEAEEIDFSDVDLARANLIRELSDNMGANDAGIDIILHLIDQLHGMRSAMEDLRDALTKKAGTED